MESQHAESEHVGRRRALHSVQFYRNDAFLIEAVVRFVMAGIQAGDGVVVIATPDHVHALRRVCPDAPNLFLRTTTETLNAITVDGHDEANMLRSTFTRVGIGRWDLCWGQLFGQ